MCCKKGPEVTKDPEIGETFCLKHLKKAAILESSPDGIFMDEEREEPQKLYFLHHLPPKVLSLMTSLDTFVFPPEIYSVLAFAIMPFPG